MRELSKLGPKKIEEGLRIFSNTDQQSWIPLRAPTPAIRCLHQSLVEDFLSQQLSGQSKVVGPENDRMEYLILDSLRFRRCLVYIVLQYSEVTKQLRILPYGIDYVFHSGGGFGTSLKNVKKDRLIEEIGKMMKRDQWKVSASMLEALKKSRPMLFL